MNKNNGVTLIVLVITIAVLLILLSTSVYFINGRNGIVDKAIEATSKENQYEESQQQQIERIYDQLDDRPSTDPTEETPKIDEEPVQPEPDPGEEWPYVPDGFKVIPGKDNPLEGFTITDDQNGQEKQGNEFVFIPVLDINTFKEDNTYKKSVYYDEESSEDYQQMLKSVEKNKGFYIGRYEMSLDSSETAQSKYLQTPKNHISQTKAQQVCEKYATKYNTKHQSETKLATGLLWGKNWDAVLRFLEGKKSGEGTVLEEETIKNNSTKWGNYYNTIGYTIKGMHGYKNTAQDILWVYDGNIKKQLDNTILIFNVPISTFLQTGSTDRNMAKNIYDLAGNFSEWTREKTKVSTWMSSKIQNVYRGGSANVFLGMQTDGKSVSERGENDGEETVSITGRMLMYRIEE